MNTTITHKGFDNLAMINGFNDLFALAPNKISTLKKVITFITDEQSAKHSFDILENLVKTKKEIISNTGLIDTIEKSDSFLKKTIQNLACVNGLLDFVDSIFTKPTSVETEIQIDDDNMLTMMSNFQKVKNLLEYIHSYASLVNDAQKSKKSILDNPKSYTIQEVLDLLNCAA